MTEQQIEELLRRLQKEQRRTPYYSAPWRHVILLAIAILCFAYLFYDRWARYQTETGVVMAVVLLIGSIVGYYVGSSKNESDRAKADAAKSLQESQQPPINE